MGRDGGRRGGSSHTAVAVAPLFSNLNDWAVWVATGVLCSGAFARHGLFAAGLYWALTAVVSVVDPSLHSLQMLNLVAVVYDLSFELHRLYLLVSHRPFLIGCILSVALVAEWGLERMEDGGKRPDTRGGEPNTREGEPTRAVARRAGALGSLASAGANKVRRFSSFCGPLIAPGVAGVAVAAAAWLLLPPLLLQPSLLLSPLLDWRTMDGAGRCESVSDCIFLTGSAFQRRIHGVYVLTTITCAGKPVYRQRSQDDALYLHSPGHEHQWNIGPGACMSSPRHKWMERFSVATTAEALGNGTWFETSSSSTYVRNDGVSVSSCPAEVVETLRVRRRVRPGAACILITGSSQDGVFVQDGECNGKPSYTRIYVSEGREPLPASLYSPARRNSWLIGTDPCRANGWVEVRSAAERAEFVQAGASGPWQEYNGSSWARSSAIRALTHCGSAAAGCAYLSGSRHQQHTHGLYTPAGRTCSGKPVYAQQTEGGASEQGLFLYAPAGRESWMVGREACKPSGWLEVHSSAPFVEAIHGVWREHVPGGNWDTNPGIQLQLHPLQDAFSGFSFADDRASLRDPNQVLWRLTALLSTDLAPPEDAERALIEESMASRPPARNGGWESIGARLRSLRGHRRAANGDAIDAEAEPPTSAEATRRLAVGRRMREAAAAAAGRSVTGRFFEDNTACADLAVEPSLEGGRLLLLEHTHSASRKRLAAMLPALGWSFAWTSSAHYTSPAVREWLRAVESVRTRRHPMRPRASNGSEIREATTEPQSADLGLLGWRKVPFRAADVVALERACAAEGLALDGLTLLAADRVQLIPLSALSLVLPRLARHARAHAAALAVATGLLLLTLAALCVRRTHASGHSVKDNVRAAAAAVWLPAPVRAYVLRVRGGGAEPAPRRGNGRGGGRHTSDERRQRRGAAEATTSRVGTDRQGTKHAGPIRKAAEAAAHGDGGTRAPASPGGESPPAEGVSAESSTDEPLGGAPAKRISGPSESRAQSRADQTGSRADQPHGGAPADPGAMREPRPQEEGGECPPPRSLDVTVPEAAGEGVTAVLAAAPAAPAATATSAFPSSPAAPAASAVSAAAAAVPSATAAPPAIAALAASAVPSPSGASPSDGSDATCSDGRCASCSDGSAASDNDDQQPSAVAQPSHWEASPSQSSPSQAFPSHASSSQPSPSQASSSHISSSLPSPFQASPSQASPSQAFPPESKRADSAAAKPVPARAGGGVGRHGVARPTEARAGATQSRSSAAPAAAGERGVSGESVAQASEGWQGKLQDEPPTRVRVASVRRGGRAAPAPQQQRAAPAPLPAAVGSLAGGLPPSPGALSPSASTLPPSASALPHPIGALPPSTSAPTTPAAAAPAPWTGASSSDDEPEWASGSPARAGLGLDDWALSTQAVGAMLYRASGERPGDAGAPPPHRYQRQPASQANTGGGGGGARAWGGGSRDDRPEQSSTSCSSALPAPHASRAPTAEERDISATQAHGGPRAVERGGRNAQAQGNARAAPPVLSVAGAPSWPSTEHGPTAAAPRGSPGAPLGITSAPPGITSAPLGTKSSRTAAAAPAIAPPAMALPFGAAPPVAASPTMPAQATPSHPMPAPFAAATVLPPPALPPPAAAPRAMPATGLPPPALPAPAMTPPAAPSHAAPGPTPPVAVAPAPERQFSLSDAWLAERAALSVLDDFPFDLPVHLREEEHSSSSPHHGYGHHVNSSQGGAGCFGAGPFASFGVPFAPPAGAPLPSLPPPSGALPPRLEELNASAPVFDPARQAAAHAAAVAQAHAMAQAHAAALFAAHAGSQAQPSSAGQYAAPAAAQGSSSTCGFSAADMDRVVQQFAAHAAAQAQAAAQAREAHFAAQAGAQASSSSAAQLLAPAAAQYAAPATAQFAPPAAAPFVPAAGAHYAGAQGAAPVSSPARGFGATDSDRVVGPFGAPAGAQAPSSAIEFGGPRGQEGASGVEGASGGDGAPGAMGDDRGGFSAMDVDRVVAGMSKEEMVRMMREMQKRLERD